MLRDFLAALYDDWLALVSGIASVVLAVWVALFAPSSEVARKALWLTFAICLFVAAYRIWAREHRLYVEEKAKHQRFRLVFEVDETASLLSFRDSLLLNLVIRFENRDAHDWTMKRLDFRLFQIEQNMTKEVTTSYDILFRDYADKQAIPNEQFEPMVVQAGRTTSFYEVAVFMNVRESVFSEFDKGQYFLRVGMEAVGQPIFEKDFHLFCKDYMPKLAILMSFEDEAWAAFRRTMRRLSVRPRQFESILNKDRRRQPGDVEDR